MAISLLEKILTSSKKESLGTEQILHELKNDNMVVSVSLDTSITAVTAVNLNKVFGGGKCRNVTVVTPGGGLYLQRSLSEPVQVYAGDRLTNEEIEILRWKGAGTGTAVIELSGVR